MRAGAQRRAGAAATGERPRRRWALGLMLTVTGAMFAASAPEIAKAQRPSPDQVEAAYLYNFGKFVRWPDAASAGPLTLCVTGRETVSETLRQLAAGDDINGRELAVRPVDRVEQAGACSVLFVGAAETKNANAWLTATKDKPILTVGDGQDFLASGGIIQFVLEGDHVRFSVNLDAANQSGLQLSSELLKVAVNVVGKPAGGGR